MQELLVTMGAEIMASFPGEFDKWVKSEVACWRKVVQASNLQPD